ncbi:glycosyltransferase [Dyella flagellata]|uniref:Glycosyl transferase n=1 Tax=Dyella flagellata TaxID=1867833 RepID=A0ABQ5XAL5_9GAMM|nr:glycosyltransferase [Dyella flagellata]GLQ88216.1 glycosyl transferase [Dyella flagellata]
MPNRSKAIRCQVIGRDNGAGLSRDIALLSRNLIGAGVDVTASALPHRGRLAEWTTRLRLLGRPPAFDLNIMLERIRPEFSRAARHNVLIPNPEYFRPRDRAALNSLDAVWVKTRHAERLFQALGMPVRYIGFTSMDCRRTEVPRERSFFHGPGRSNNKGTQALLELWAQHPDWPVLTVVWRRKRTEPMQLPANVKMISHHLDDDAYRRLQNAHRFHLCPSQTEGFGHYIVEAMSCAAVVITLDAEPMHELVAPERGILVPARPCGQQDLADRFGFDAKDMATAIERCIALSDAQTQVLGKAARSWYENEVSSFPQRLSEALMAF